jgi:mRNA interferase HigB
MNLVGGEVIEDFKAKNADSRIGLDKFKQDVANCNAKHFIELKDTFSGVDYVAPNYVFNISGTSYRLLAAVSFKIQTVIVKQIDTHAGYDKWKLKK